MVKRKIKANYTRITPVANLHSNPEQSETNTRYYEEIIEQTDKISTQMGKAVKKLRLKQKIKKVINFKH